MIHGNAYTLLYKLKYHLFRIIVITSQIAHPVSTISQTNLLKHSKSDHVRFLLKVLQWLFSSLQVRVKAFPMACKVLQDLPPTPFTHSDIISSCVAYSVPAALTSAHNILAQYTPKLAPSPTSNLCFNVHFCRMPSLATFKNHSPDFWHTLAPFSAIFFSIPPISINLLYIFLSWTFCVFSP